MDFDQLMQQRELENSSKMNVRSRESRYAIMRNSKETNDQNDTNFYYSREEEVKIAGDYYGVRIFITDTVQKQNGSKQLKWTDTRMQGVLRIMMIQDVGVPIAVIRLMRQDQSGKVVEEMILEYELPTNFNQCNDLAATFSAIQIMKGQFIGILFQNEKDKKLFGKSIVELCRVLSLSKDKIKEIRSQARQLMDRVLNIKLEDTVDKDELLNGNDQTKQAEELRKILILAGLDVSELSNPQTVQTIMNVLNNFDPTSFDEEEFVFNAKAEDFNQKRRQAAPSEMRRIAKKKVDESYYTRLAEREKQEAIERQARQEKELRTSQLKDQFQQIERQSMQDKEELLKRSDTNSSQVKKGKSGILASMSSNFGKLFGGNKRDSAKTQVFRSQSEVVTSLAIKKSNEAKTSDSGFDDSLNWAENNNTSSGQRTQSDIFDSRQFQSEVVGLNSSSPFEKTRDIKSDYDPFESRGPRQSGFRQSRPILLDTVPNQNETAIPERTEESSATPVIDQRPARRTAMIMKQKHSSSSSS